MVRSMTKRGMPKPFAILIAALLAMYFVPLGATAASATEPSLTLEGCRGSASSFPAMGPFVCPDDEYTTGNLQKFWNELDLVPFRITSTASAGDTFPFTTTLAADYIDNGNLGYDFISVPVVNDDLSDASCAITNVGSLLYDQPSLGGSDGTIRRDLTWTQTTGKVCVFDYYQRLALGSAKYPGSNLQAYLGVDNGKKTVPLPVNQIEPQGLDKTMDATQGSTYDWTVAKIANPTNVAFDNTCAQSTESKSHDVTITVNWTRSAKLPSGDVHLTTNITATNPAHREITVNVTDKMYEGIGQTTLLATSQGTFDVAAGDHHTFTFTEDVPSSASTFNDVATATYTDKATGVAVPGNTTANASATVDDTGQVTGHDATISDVESITGAGFSYQVNSVTPSEGSFGGYTLNTYTTDDVTWSNTLSPAGTGAASGSFVFSKTVRVDAGTVGSGSLHDTVTLTPGGQSAQTANASVALSADAANPQLRFTKRVDIAPDSDATFTFAVRAKDGQGGLTGPTYTFTVVIPAGQTSATSAYQSVAPSANGYHYSEAAASGYTGVDGDIQALAKCAVHTATVDNTRDLGKIEIKKVIEGDPIGTSTDFTVRVDCPGTAYDEDVALNEGNGWVNTTGTIPTGTVCTLTEVNVPDGWNPEGFAPDGADSVSVTVGDGAVSAVVTNKRRTGKLEVIKVIEGDPAGASTEFTVHIDCPGDDYDQNVVLNQANDWTVTKAGIPSGLTCTVTEPSVPAGWERVSIEPSSVVIDSYDVVSVTVTNVRQTGSVEVNKVVVGDVAGASTEFSVLLDCDGTAYDETLVLDQANSWTAGADDIPTLVECQVTEPSVPAGWSLTSISPAGKFTVMDTTIASVTVTNTRTTGRISVTKVLDGAPNGASTSFTFDVDCPGTDYDQPVTVAVTSGTSATGTTGLIPTGLTCTVTERAVPDWKVTSVVPAGGVVAVGSTVTFTNQRLQGTLNISKAVSPVAGNGVVVNFGDTLTYTLTVSATGEQRQPNVVVTDYLPGSDPARPGSGKATYVAGSAACVGSGTCTVSGPDANGLITWSLGEMAAGTTRQVTFKVTIDDVAGDPGDTIAVDIINAGAVQSDRTPKVLSNEVVTPVTKVLAVKIPKQLPHTGTTLPIGPAVGTGIVLLVLGLLLASIGRRRTGMHRH